MRKDVAMGEIAFRTGLPKNEVKQVVDELDNLIFECIASNDKINFNFGTIGGKVKPPALVKGYYVKYSGNWCFAKIGYPYIEWSKATKACEVFSPIEWFDKYGYPENFNYIPPTDTFISPEGVAKLSKGKETLDRKQKILIAAKKKAREKREGLSSAEEKDLLPINGKDLKKDFEKSCANLEDLDEEEKQKKIDEINKDWEKYRKEALYKQREYFKEKKREKNKL